ncbi:Metalloendoproteinase 5-MMP [Spatholobus suberectus]|nr:Metalloendoproteinase 5-MMP [Spatholobus suberectus]
MKSYIPAFLLFLLLVDQPLSASLRVPSFLTKEIYNSIRGKVQNYLWKKSLENIIQQFSPPQPNAPPQPNSPPQPKAPPMQIKGLSEIKQYFYNFGYFPSSGPFDDYLDQKTISAITTYQQYFNLQATGYLNNETFQQISLPRCDVPDMNFNYYFYNGTVSWPKAGYRWFPGRNLTYAFLLASKIPASMTTVFREAFARWAQATGVLNLTETTYDDADIKVGFYNFGSGVMDVEWGDSIVRLQPGSNVTTGEIRLDATKFWALPSENYSLSWQQGVLDLERNIGLLDHCAELVTMFPLVPDSLIWRMYDNTFDSYTTVRLADNQPQGMKIAAQQRPGRMQAPLFNVDSSSRDQEIAINMKSYLSALLLFLLLVDLSLSPTAGLNPVPVGKAVGFGGKKAIKSILTWVKKGKKIYKNLPPPQPNAPPPPEQIPGLPSIKDYFYNYGYLKSSGPFNDSLDQETISAFKTYQQYFHLQVTGDLNNQTLLQMSLLRCGVPDMNFYYTSPTTCRIPKPGTGGSTRQTSPTWALATGVLNFTETTYDNADIKVGFYNFTYLEIDEEVDGGSIILLQPASNVTIVGMILLDGTKLWALPSENDSLSWQDGVLDLETASCTWKQKIVEC